MRHFLSYVILFTSVVASAAAQTSPTLSAAPSPWVVKGIVAEVTGTSGFARDAALEQAARIGLPQVLTRTALMTEAEAVKRVAALGEAMRFVARYNIVKEAVLPTYSLTADLTFNETLVRKNFGGVVTPTVVMSGAAPSGVAGTAQAPAAATQAYVVRVGEPTPAGQDRARRALAALPGTLATLRLISVAGIELDVATSQPEAALREALAGYQAEITPALAPVLAPALAAPVQEDSPTAQPAAAAAMPEVYEPAPAAQPAAPMAPVAAPKRTLPTWLPDLW